MPSPCHFLISGQLLRTSENSNSFSISLQGSSVLHSAQTLERYRVDMLNSGYYIVLINSHEDIFRYISGHAVLDEDDSR